MPKEKPTEQERGVGFISIHRQVKENWIYEKGRRRTKFEAWLDILMTATYASNKEPIGFDLIQVNRGQLLTSQDKLSKEWMWDRGAVRSFLQMLQKDGMISTETTTKYTLITICKYEDYQSLKPTRQQQLNNNSTSTQHQVPTLNKGNKDNKGNNDKESIYTGILLKWNQWAEINKKSKVVKLSNLRKTHLSARLKEESFDFDKILEIASESNYITKPDSAWFSLDWVISSETNYLKVLEGKYGYTPQQTYTPTEKDSWI